MGAVMKPTDAGPARRTVLVAGVGAGAALLSGCALNNPFSSGRTPAAEAVRDLAPDVGVAVQAVALITAAQRELDALVEARPALGASLAPLAETYRAHAAALTGAVPDGVDATGTPTPEPKAGPTLGAGSRATALRTAATLHAQLTGFALRAESGAFARLLGSMAAGLSQQLVVLGR